MADRDAWLAARRRYIGSSDAGACMLDDEGYPFSPWGSPYTVWLDKLGMLPDVDNEMMAAGRYLESAVRDWFEDVSDNPFVRRPGMMPGFLFEGGREQPGCWGDPKTPIFFRDWQSWSPDGAIPSPAMRPLEIKVIDAYKREDWEDVDLGLWPPPVYYAQLQHAMVVSGTDSSTIVVLFLGRGTRDLQWAEVPRDESFIERMTDAERIVYDCVQSGDPPPIDPSPQTARAMGIHAPPRAKRVGSFVEPVPLPPEAFRWDDEYVMASASLKPLTRLKDGAATLIRGAIGDGEIGVLPNGIQYRIDKGGRMRRIGHPQVVTEAEATLAAQEVELEVAVRTAVSTTLGSCVAMVSAGSGTSAHLQLWLQATMESAARIGTGNETADEALMLAQLMGKS